MLKESSRIYTGSFYIVADKILYALDKSANEEEYIGHADLWEILVPKLFSHIPFEIRQDLKVDAVYGADRGRVVFKGEATPTGAPKSGAYSIYGTPGCEKYKDRIKAIYGLNKIDKLPQFSLEEDFKTDPHYKIKSSDKKLLDEIVSSSKTQLEQKPADIKIAKDLD